MPEQIAIVDAFTEKPFAGNSAAVCLLERPRDPAWMQQLAREFNLPATVFIAAEDAGYHLRWFSPTVELGLCGHGTLASAHLLWELGHADVDAPLHFRTAGGALTCRREAGWVLMDFPAEPALPVAAPPGDLTDALGVTALAVARNRLDYLVELVDEDAVRAVRPDMQWLSAVETRGVMVTAPAATADYDFVSRFFAPSAGILEDPATGSAHCALGPYWGERLGKAEVTGRQLSDRGGTIRVRLAGERVAILGRAVTVLRGELLQ